LDPNTEIEAFMSSRYLLSDGGWAITVDVHPSATGDTPTMLGVQRLTWCLLPSSSGEENCSNGETVLERGSRANRPSTCGDRGTGNASSKEAKAPLQQCLSDHIEIRFKVFYTNRAYI
jgi:hypothetical protein